MYLIFILHHQSMFMPQNKNWDEPGFSSPNGKLHALLNHQVHGKPQFEPSFSSKNGEFHPRPLRLRKESGNTIERNPGLSRTR